MSHYNIDRIASVLQASYLQQTDANGRVEHLLIDSRRIIHPSTALFFALRTERRNGHDYINEAYNKGVRHFIVQEPIDVKAIAEANVLLVADTLKALQQLAAYHRQQFSIPVIGITGSNGKTIVKEWLHQLLSDHYNIIRSPKSYNSQVGVPLSVWQFPKQNNLAIF